MAANAIFQFMSVNRNGKTIYKHLI